MIHRLKFKTQILSTAMAAVVALFPFLSAAGGESESKSERECESDGECERGCDCQSVCELQAPCSSSRVNIHAEFLYLWRATTSREVDFTGQFLTGPIVLAADDLDFGGAPGLRITGTYDLCDGDQLELAYFGALDWSSRASAASATNNLFSVFSDFGFAPLGGFTETDQASLHTLDYSSHVENIEFNWRTLISERDRLQWWGIVGFRYMRMDESMLHGTQVELHIDPFSGLPRGPAGLRYQVETGNDLAGLQIGRAVNWSPSCRLSLDGEVKAGVYGIHASQHTQVNSSSFPAPVIETESQADVALVADAALTAVYRIASCASLRAGYRMMYLNGVALAVENFNSTTPITAARPVTVNHNGAVLYHGLNVGLELRR